MLRNARCDVAHLPDEAGRAEQLSHEGDADELEVSQLFAAVSLHAEDQLLHLLLLLLLLGSSPADGALHCSCRGRKHPD